MNVIALFSLILNAAAYAVAAMPAQEPAFTFDHLKKIIEQDKLTSFDEVLPKLPAELRSNFVLIYQSHSSQRNSIDLMTPRTVLFDRKAQILIAFTSDPNKPEYDRIEVIQFNPTTSRFEFKLLDFSNARQTGAPKVSENPRSCASCHGHDPRPFWETYAFWPGVYGSNDDQFEKSYPETAAYDRFLKTRKHLGRYSHLDWKGGPQLAGGVTLAERPNFRLISWLSHWNARRIFRMLRESPDYEQGKWQLAKRLACGKAPLEPKGLFETLAESARTKIARDHVNRGAYTFDESALLKRPGSPFRYRIPSPKLIPFDYGTSNMRDLDEVSYAAITAMIIDHAQRMGADTSEWAMSQVDPYGFFNGAISLGGQIGLLLIEDVLGKSEPELVRAHTLNYWDANGEYAKEIQQGAPVYETGRQLFINPSSRLCKRLGG